MKLHEHTGSVFTAAPYVLSVFTGKPSNDFANYCDYKGRTTPQGLLNALRNEGYNANFNNPPSPLGWNLAGYNVDKSIKFAEQRFTLAKCLDYIHRNDKNAFYFLGFNTPVIKTKKHVALLDAKRWLLVDNGQLFFTKPITPVLINRRYRVDYMIKIPNDKEGD